MTHPGRDGNHLELEIRRTDKDSGDHVYNTGEHPLSRLLARNHIEGYQYAAGDRFRADYERAILAPLRASTHEERVHGGTAHSTLADYKLDAMQRVNAVKADLNPISWLMVERNADLARLAASASSRDMANSRVRSRTVSSSAF